MTEEEKIKIIESLLEKGANLNAKDNQSPRELLSALKKNAEENNNSEETERIIQKLIEKGANLNVKDSQSPRELLSALKGNAEENNNSEEINKLINGLNSVNINQQEDKKTPVYMDTEVDNPPINQFLLEFLATKPELPQKQ